MSDPTIDLEARMAWYERQLGELDLVVRQLFEEVVRLRRELDALRQDEMPEMGPSNDPPPHY